MIKKPEYALEELIKGEQTHLLILESIQDPGNLGTMVRTGEGAGITGVIMNHMTAIVLILAAVSAMAVLFLTKRRQMR